MGVSILLNHIPLYCHEISNYVIMTKQHELALTIQGVYFMGINFTNFSFQRIIHRKQIIYMVCTLFLNDLWILTLRNIPPAPIR